MVGVLVAIALYLISYQAHKHKSGEMLSDDVISTIAGWGLLFVALLPTQPDDCHYSLEITGISAHWANFAYFHFVGALVFFVA